MLMCILQTVMEKFQERKGKLLEVQQLFQLSLEQAVEDIQDSEQVSQDLEFMEKVEEWLDLIIKKQR